MVSILNVVCQNADVLRMVFYIKMILKIAFIIVPIGLVVKVILDVYKNIVLGNSDDAKKNNKVIINRVIAAVCVFLVYPIVNLIFGIEAINQVDYIQCWNNATSLEEIEKMHKTLVLVAEDGGIDGSDKFSCTSPSCEFDLPKAYKNNYEFTGWSRSSSCNSLIKDKITVTEKETTLYACFKKNQTSIPVTPSTNNIIFVGDSRTVQMCNYLNSTMSSNEKCVAEGSQDIDWFKSTAINKINNILNEDKNKVYNIIIDLGVNGLKNGNAEKYYTKYNELANGSWSRHNIIVTSVTPVDPNKYPNGQSFNSKIKLFNQSLKSGLNSKITYCNIYDKVFDIIDDNSATDDNGLHYKKSASTKIYNMKKACIR